MKKPKQQSQPEAQEISYRLKGFLIRRFTLVEPGMDIRNEFNPNKLKLGLDVNFAHNIENSSFQVHLTILNQYELEGKDILLLELILQSEFEIQDLATILKIENEYFRIPDDILTTFVSLSYSSARGIIFAKTQGSFLNQFILPVIDPKSLLDQKKEASQVIPPKKKK